MTRCLLLACLIAFAPVAHAEDWTQFLGAKRDSSCSTTVTAWKDAPKELWATPVGEGHSSPVVKGDTVFLFTKLKGKEEEGLAAFDLKTGKPKWEKSYPREKFTNAFGNGPRGTPAIDGDYVYTYGCNGLLTCWAIKDGEQKWQLDTLKEFKAKNLYFGVSTSVTVVGDVVVVMVGGTGAHQQDHRQGGVAGDQRSRQLCQPDPRCKQEPRLPDG
jgi:outer membrane protein assembly factor BamB